MNPESTLVMQNKMTQNLRIAPAIVTHMLLQKQGGHKQEHSRQYKILLFLPH